MSGDQNTNGAGWKFATTALVSLVLGIGGSYFTFGRDVITKGDLSTILAQQQKQLDSQTAALAAENEKISTIAQDVAAMKEYIALDSRHRGN